MLVTQFIQGKLNVMAGKLSCWKEGLPTKWTLDPLVCLNLSRLWGRLTLDLFATSRNHRLPLFSSPAPDPLAWATDASPPFSMVRGGVEQIWFSLQRNYDPHSPVLASERVAPRLSAVVGGLPETPSLKTMFT